jgi:chorismate--pyruvate lyase
MALAIIQDMKFPSSIKKPWHAQVHPSASPAQKYWLHRPGALTAGLRRLGLVHLDVVREYACRLNPQEAALIRKPPGTLAWVREVSMSVDGIRCVVARSFTPLAASHSVWQGIRRLRSRPLADMLYNDAQIQRSAFLSCRLHRGMSFFRSVERACKQDKEPVPHAPLILSRCSVFWRHGQPLLVAESFMPAFWDHGATLA